MTVNSPDEPEAAVAEPNPAPAAGRSLRSIPPRVWIAVGVVAAAVVALLVWQAARPKPFTMRGSVTMYDRTVGTDGDSFAIVDPDGDATCHGVGGYSDMAPGAQVTVYNAHGDIVGASQIERSFGMEPMVAGDAVVDAGFCSLDWSVADVPGGQGPYQYEVSHRGRLTVTEADAREGRISSSLGE